MAWRGVAGRGGLERGSARADPPRSPAIHMERLGEGGLCARLQGSRGRLGRNKGRAGVGSRVGGVGTDTVSGGDQT